MKIRVYLEHGHKIDVVCDDYEFIRNTAEGIYTSYHFKGTKKTFGFRPELMVGWERIK